MFYFGYESHRLYPRLVIYGIGNIKSLQILIAPPY